MVTVLKLYIARGRQLGRSLSCELKGKPSQQDIPDFGAVLNDIDRTVDVRYMWAWPVDRTGRSAVVWPTGIELCLSGRSERA